MAFRAQSLRLARGAVTVVVAVVGAATLLGLLDRYLWVFELADVFRLQYLAVLAAAGVAALALRRAHLAGIAGALAALNAAAIGISFAPPASAAAGPGSGNLRLLVANVEVGNTRFAGVARLVARSGADIVGVTELTPALAAHLARALPGYHARLVAPRADAYGVGVFSRVPLLSARVAHFPAGGPPTIVARVRVAGRPVTVVVTHSTRRSRARSTSGTCARSPTRGRGSGGRSRSAATSTRRRGRGRSGASSATRGSRACTAPAPGRPTAGRRGRPRCACRSTTAS